MSYGDLQYHKENADYWFKHYVEATGKAESAIAEAKKSKERLLSSARLALKYKRSDEAIKRIAEAEQDSGDYVEFGDKVIWILRELGYECD
ncbi:hypothetical protein ACFWNC_14820 [Streptomyces sp. NPDC058369]|uniref:hypothetical protein n=1 Tax=Streptomyces sp. NPDC058369 TaxID=3346462 RepID=UPI0036625301